MKILSPIRVLSLSTLVFTIYLVFEVLEEIQDNEPLSEIILEVGSAVALFAAFGWLAFEVISRLDQLQKVSPLSQKGVEFVNENQVAKKVGGGALSESVDSVVFEFKKWSLTKSESEVAKYLLEGLSLAKIAEKRFTSVKTVRNQAGSIYQKSGLSGRAELSAHFIDL